MALSTTVKGKTIHIGDTLAVSQEIVEDEKKRTQTFQGRLIAIKGQGKSQSFTVRKIATGSVGVERIWPVVSPLITKVEVVKHAQVRRSKLYYLRERLGKRSEKLKETKTKKSTKPKAKSEPKTAGKKG